jgi:hypothetical protein
MRVLTAGLKATHLQRDRFRFDASLQTRYGEGDEGVIARNHYGTLAMDLRPSRPVSPFLFAEAEHDRFKRIGVRASGGAGAKYTFYHDQASDNEASISLAVLLSHEHLLATAQDPFPDSRTIGRYSLRMRGSQQLPSGVRLQHVSFYQPLLEQWSDYLLRSETGARITLVERLALSVTYEFNRTALPPEGVAPDDRLVRTGIILDF